MNYSQEQGKYLHCYDFNLNPVAQPSGFLFENIEVIHK